MRYISSRNDSSSYTESTSCPRPDILPLTQRARLAPGRTFFLLHREHVLPQAGHSALFTMCERPQMYSLCPRWVSRYYFYLSSCVTTRCTVSGLSCRPCAIAFSAALQIVTHVYSVRFSSFSSVVCIVTSLIPMTIR